MFVTFDDAVAQTFDGCIDEQHAVVAGLKGNVAALCADEHVDVALDRQHVDLGFVSGPRLLREAVRCQRAGADQRD
ncbi:MAG: hypothetical protein DMG00_26850 [Acidobacteria bacterium]|nr:MAG: hypothetical protein DMG00_26850 [Acidobacteriota bacterium]